MTAGRSEISEGAVADAIARLDFSLALQEHAGLPKPPRMRGKSRRERAARGILAWDQRRDRTRIGRRRRIADRAVVAGLRAVTGTFWSLGPRTIGTAADERAASGSAQTDLDVAGYVTTSAKEDQVIRLAFLLRLLNRNREAIDLLARRVESTLPSRESQRWLARLLERGGEKKAAALLAHKSATPAEPCRRPATAKTRLRYGVVMLSMSDSPVFRASVGSVLRSDYSGEIVVVEDGPARETACREFCERAGIGYVKQADWRGSAAAMNAGIAALPADTDIIVFAHNDVLWAPDWFQALTQAWDATLDFERVGLLNLGYLQFKRDKTSDLDELFRQGRYDDLRWLLGAMKDVQQLQDRVQDSQVRTGGLFGLARDPWNDWAPYLRFMTGRFSVAASFRMKTWRSLGGFDEEMPYGFDIQLQHHCLANRRWMLFVNNPPLIHLVSSDTRELDPTDREVFGDKIRQTYEAFERKFGWQLEHFLNIYFSESAFIYQDEIVRAANALRFADVDFVFTDFEDRLSARRLANCELTWCRSRPVCKYVGLDAPTGDPVARPSKSVPL